MEDKTGQFTLMPNTDIYDKFLLPPSPQNDGF